MLALLYKVCTFVVQETLLKGLREALATALNNQFEIYRHK
jgi:hypothetical protein